MNIESKMQLQIALIKIYAKMEKLDLDAAGMQWVVSGLAEAFNKLFVSNPNLKASAKLIVRLKRAL